MPEVVIEKQPVLDLLDLKTPALSATTDIPVIETKPDASPVEVKPETPPEAKEPAAQEKAETPAPSETPEDPAAEPEPKKAKGVQKRIDELLAREREAIRRAEAADARLDRALAALEKPVKDAPVVEEEPQKPVKDPNNPEAYDAALEQYVSDRAGWVAERKVKESLAAEEQKRADERLADETKRVQESYRSRVEKVKEKYADYTEVAESPDVQVSIPMASAIAHSEEGPEIAYFLGQDFKNGGHEAERISKLAPPLQLVELGKIVARLNTPAAPKPVSAAPKPGTPTKPSSETTPSPEEESMEAYAARRKKELAEARRPGVRH